MECKTKYFDVIDIEDNEVIHFSNGLPGFPNETDFVFMPFVEESPFFIMQSAQTQSLAFFVTSPFLFFKEYNIIIPDNFVEQLQLTSPKDVNVWVILTIKDDIKKATANLVAPVLVNQKKQIGKQVVLEKTNYNVSHPLFPNGIKGGERHASSHT